MSEGKRTITVTVHEADEVPTAGQLVAYMQTSEGFSSDAWAIVYWYGDGWSTVGTMWPIIVPGLWVELKDIAQAVEEDKS